MRYISTIDEQIEDLRKTTLEDVKQFHSRFYGASKGELVISGQFNKADMQKLVEELFGAWKSQAPYQEVLLNYQQAQPIDRKIETPDKQNATVFAGVSTKMARAIFDEETIESGGRLFLVAGPWARDGNVVNPSYWWPRAFATFVR